MNTKLSKHFCFSNIDFGSVGILPESVLRIFQDVATEHIELLGYGIKNLRPRNLLWVATRIKFEILSQPKPDEELEIVTYASGQNHFEFFRDFLIFDKNKNLLIKGLYRFSLLDEKERHIARLSKIQDIKLPCLTSVFEGRFLSIESFEPEFSHDHTYKILPDDIDANGHTNNTVYAKMINELLNLESQKISFFQINYLKETLLTERIDLYKNMTDNTLKILGKICEGKPCCLIEITFKNEKNNKN